MFSSFLQAGFECSTFRRKDGSRLDIVASTGHDRFVNQDYARLGELRIRTVREGLRWHLIDQGAGTLDFSSVDPSMRAAKKHGVEIVWDLLHFGWPGHLDLFSEEWVAALAALARGFGRYLREAGQARAWVAPVNEISFFAWGGGDAAVIEPYAGGRGAELKVQLVKGALAAIRALREELPDARILSPEPVIHIVGDPRKPGDVEDAERYRQSMFEAWDMLTGRSHPELGGDVGCLDALGVNYYSRNQWRNFGTTVWRWEPEYRPFHKILMETHERYRLPMSVSETGEEDDARPGWFAYIAEEVRAARAMGVPVHGICWYPILNHPGWDDDRHCYNGLWDYPREDGSREICRPLADEMVKYLDG